MIPLSTVLDCSSEPLLGPAAMSSNNDIPGPPDRDSQQEFTPAPLQNFEQYGECLQKIFTYLFEQNLTEYAKAPVRPGRWGSPSDTGEKAAIILRASLEGNFCSGLTAVLTAMQCGRMDSAPVPAPDVSPFTSYTDEGPVAVALVARPLPDRSLCGCHRSLKYFKVSNWRENNRILGKFLFWIIFKLKKLFLEHPVQYGHRYARAWLSMMEHEIEMEVDYIDMMELRLPLASQRPTYWVFVYERSPLFLYLVFSPVLRML